MQTNPTGGCLGIDINHADAVTNFGALATTGAVEFFGYKVSEGVGFKDPAFPTRWELAGERGYTRLAYHFLDPSQSAHDQFNTYTSHLADAGGTVASDIVVLDWEKDNATAARQQQASLWFLQELAQVFQRKPLVYCNLDFAKRYATVAHGDYPLWLAYYPGNPLVQRPNLAGTPWAKTGWKIWQFAADDKGWLLPGCSNTLDMNVYNGTHEQMVADLCGVTRMASV